MLWRNRRVTVGSFGIKKTVASLFILTLKLRSVSERLGLATGDFGVLFAIVQSLIKIEVTVS